MRTTPTLRILTAALLTGGTFAAAAAGTTASATPSSTHTSDRDGGRDGYGDRGGRGSPVWGTVVSRTDAAVRSGPSVGSRVVDRLSPGSQDRIQCGARGQSLNGNSTWYWMVGARGWVNAGSVDTGGRWVKSCSDPCPRWRDGDRGGDRGGNDWNGSDWDGSGSGWDGSGSGWDGGGWSGGR